MQLVPLGRTGLTVSALCLGTMTWGSQNTLSEGHAQADMAVDHGVTFWDTAEMYPTNPVRAETVGDTERVIGAWLAARGGRDRLVLATKVTGSGQVVRGGQPITGAVMRAAVEESLGRLNTDYIDLYQLHWPNRGTGYHFRGIWSYDPRGIDRAAADAHMIDVLETARDLIAEGKIRHIGLSNETVWGAARWLHLADLHGLPRMMSVQNEYSLLCRQFDTDWAELATVEDMPLLAFSPLATGLLTGKYAGDVTPAGSRRAINATMSGRMTPQALRAVEAYSGIAARHGLDPARMAIAFCAGRPFPIIPIIGATNLAQLATNMDAASLRLSAEVLAEIDGAHRAHPQPY